MKKQKILKIGVTLLFAFAVTFSVVPIKIADAESKGTLYGNADGSKYCCCPGNNSCGSAGCAAGVCP